MDQIADEYKQEAQRLTRRVSAIQAERLKWAENAMNDSVPGDIAAAKQTELAAQLATAEARLKGLTASDDDSRTLIDKAIGLLDGSATGYLSAGRGLRRVYDQTWYQHIFVDDDSTSVRVASTLRTEDIAPVYDHAASVAVEAGGGDDADCPTGVVGAGWCAEEGAGDVRGG